VNIRTVDAAYGWRWIVAGMQLFKKNPAQWLFMFGTLFVASRLLFLIPFMALLVVLLAPHFLAGLAHGAQALEQGKPLRNGYLASGFLRNAASLATIGGISLVGQVVIFMVIVAVGGDAFGDLAKSMGEGAATPESMRAMQAAAPRMMLAMLAGFMVSLPLMMATWYAPLLVFFDDLKPAAALYMSLLACIKNVLPLMVYGIVLMIPLFVFTRIGLALGLVDLGLWMLAPLIVPTIYASYRDLFVPAPPVV
jgi:hypothetical protein